MPNQHPCGKFRKGSISDIIDWRDGIRATQVSRQLVVAFGEYFEKDAVFDSFDPSKTKDPCVLFVRGLSYIEHNQCFSLKALEQQAYKSRVSHTREVRDIVVVVGQTEGIDLIV